MFEQLYPNLFSYITEMNRMAEYTDGDVIDLREKIDEPIVKRIEDKLSADLSPENLYCDGEISQEEADDKCAHYMAVASETMKLTNLPCQPEG